MSTGSAAASLNPLTMRYKRIDPNEFQALALSFLQQQGMLEAAGAAQGAAAQQGMPAQQAAAAVDPFSQPLIATAPAGSAAPAAATQGAAALAAAPAARASTPAPTAATPTTGAGTSAAATQQAVAIPSSAIAPRRPHDYWKAHIAQFRGKYLPDGPDMRPNCGPASVTTALRLLGLDIPGFNGQRSEAVLDKARIIATGRNDPSVGTTDSELERLISASGGKWSESQSWGEITGWVKQGIPVVLSGNPAHGWNHRYRSDQVYPFDGGHWVTVSGQDPKTGYYIVNDPLSQIGPIYVSEQELRSYNQSHGQLGIAVFK